MTAVYWDIGRGIVKFEQDGKHRAEYGDQLIEQLAGDLTNQFGRGFGRANLWQARILPSLAGGPIATNNRTPCVNSASIRSAATFSNIPARQAKRGRLQPRWR
ncbi:MAG: DUF1016 N-terminal domain-containing protein [Candidatus Sulfotelmatobacter sp.]|jgi:DUF1016 N-terminal domain